MAQCDSVQGSNGELGQARQKAEFSESLYHDEIFKIYSGSLKSSLETQSRSRDSN